MLVFDFDDTLYSHSTKRVPESARQSLLRLMENGELVVIATGRAPASFAFIRQALDIPLEWMIALNGQLIYHNGEMVYEKFITLPSIHEIASLSKREGFACGGVYAGGELVSIVNDRVTSVWQEFGSPPPDEVPDFLNRYPLYQGHLYATREEVERYFAPLLEDYVINWSHPTLITLISKETGKSKGIEWLMQKFAVDRRDTYAFGDGFNDKDMLLSVGHGVAMANAAADLKTAAEYIADLPDEDGIQKALAHYGILT